MEKSFYESLGEERLTDLLDRFYDKVFKSELISHLFQNTPKDIIKQKQKLFLTQFLGGPPAYTETIGPPKMRQRHIPHKITNEAKTKIITILKRDRIFKICVQKKEPIRCFLLIGFWIKNIGISDSKSSL